MRVASSVALAALLLSPTAAGADEPARPWSVGLALGYAFPVGSAERGSRLSDTTRGLVPLELVAAYRFTPTLGLEAVAFGSFGIPTLCQSASDCTSSLGTDLALALRARVELPVLGRLAPSAALGLGYEWSTSRLSDSGVGSSRAYAGPTVLSAEVYAPFVLSPRWRLGPTVGAWVGTFTRSTLQTSATSTSGAVAEHALHAWVPVNVRLEASF